MQLDYYLYKLLFKHPFKIAHTYRDHTLNAYLLLNYGDNYGWGEAVFPPYIPETQKSFTDFIRKIELPDDPTSITLNDYLPQLHHELPTDTFAIAALDIALHNLQSAITGKPIMQLYNIQYQPRPSSYTLGISSKEEMKQKIDEVEASYYKLKVNEAEIERIIQDYKSLCDKPYVIDANQGFESPDVALHWCKKLWEDKVAYMEQPFNKADYERHRWLKDKSDIPIIADESFQRYNDLDIVSQSFDGINVKLMKSGGVEEAQRSLRKARDLGLKTILGCMSESTVAVNAAWQLSPLADWVDLDGPLLVKNDPFQMNMTQEEVIEFLEDFSVAE